MMHCRNICSRTARQIICTAAVLLYSTASAAQSGAADVADRLTQRFFEIEFFVFERSAVMDFNTREILLHRQPQPYPSPLLALRDPDQAIGSGYQIDPFTQLCMVFPTLSYTLVTMEDDELTNEDLAHLNAADTPVIVEGTEATGSDSSDLNVSENQSFDPADLQIEPELNPDADGTPLDDLLAAIADFEIELEEASNRWMPEQKFTLQREARRVESRAGGRVLFHGRWLQPVPSRESPLPVMLPAGTHTGAGNELSGSVGVTLGRYLHFRTALNYRAPALGAEPLQVVFSPEGGVVPVTQTVSSDTGFMTMAQSRRMRSEELHYLDHPKLGVVVRIDPISIPEHLLDLQTALDQSEQ